MNARQLVKNAPTWVVVVCLTVFALGTTAAFVVLSVTGSSADDFSRFLNTGLNLAGILLGSGAWLSASSANDATHELKRAINDSNGEETDDGKK
jgi:hypothetical protein